VYIILCVDIILSVYILSVNLYLYLVAQETPLPSAYGVKDSDTFLLDLSRSRKTYSFKSDGRRLEPTKGGKGESLMPGAYNFKEFSDL